MIDRGGPEMHVQAEELYRNVVTLSPDSIITVDTNGVITSCNTAATKMLGYSKAEMVGKHFSKIGVLRERDLPKYLKLFTSVLRGRITKPLELTFNRKDGTPLLAEVRVGLLKEDGKMIGLQAISRDITERKKAEEAIKESEEKLRSIFEAAVDGIAYVDVSGKIVTANKKLVEEMLGYEMDETVGRNFVELGRIEPKELPRVLEKMEEAVTTGKSIKNFEVTLIRKDGRRVATEISTGVVKREGKVAGITTIVRDITERKKMEEELVESEVKYRSLFREANDALVFVDMNGILADCNPKTEELAGFKREEVLGKPFWEIGLLNMEDLPKLVSLMDVHGPRTGLELAITRRNGEKRFIEINADGVRKENNEKIGYMAIMRDITERKKMEEKLKEYAEHLEKMVEKRSRELNESEAKLKDLFKTIPDSIAIVDLNGNMLEFNKPTLELFGYPREEIIGKNVFDFIAEEDLERIARGFRQAIEKGFARIQFQVLAKDRRKIPVELNASALKDLKGNFVGFVAVIRDITERKRMEKQLLKSERLAAIGELATMVGHDLRNPLSAIQNACYYVKTKFGASKDEKMRKMFEVVGKEINHANKIVEDLLDFSRVKKPELKKADIISSVQDALAQLKFPENITLTTKFSKASTIEADPDQLRRIFQNIALNGVQAMPNGGKLTVSTIKNGGFVEVAFTDTGVGIPEENMDKLFTPLFTTKAQGVGLGLAICKNLVEGHNGRIEVKSKVCKGSTFTVTLPIRQNKGGEKRK